MAVRGRNNGEGLATLGTGEREALQGTEIVSPPPVGLLECLFSLGRTLCL